MPSPPVVQQFNMSPAKSPVNGVSSSGNAVHIPGEAYTAALKIIDPEAIFLNKLSRLLYNAYLTPSEFADPNSPVPGYKLSLISPGKDKEGKELPRHTLVNWDGYNTITNNYMLLVSEAISTTEFDTKEIQLKQFCIDGVWAIMVQLITNWEEWEFRDPAQIVPLGLELWFNLYAVSRRSTGGGHMLQFLTGLFKFLGARNKDDREDANKVSFWGKPDAN